MQFRIANTFTDSLARLTGQEQKAVKTTAFDLQLDPAGPGMQFHRLDRAKDANFWSVRVSRDIRIIVHRTAASLMLCYVDHHDDAYRWAERRRIDTHPKTGAAQLIEVRERVEALPVAADVPQEAFLPPLFLSLTDAELLDVGVPPDWLPAVRKASADTVLDVAEHLPEEAAEALLDYAVNGQLQRPAAASAPPAADPFAHPDAQRRFRVLTNVEELERALDYPWEKWTVFLHPAQRAHVERDYGGPARISGSAGTGKTIVALHRAVHLARRHADARILLTTFSATLANALKTKLSRLAGNEPGVMERIAVSPVLGLGQSMYTERYGPPKIASPEVIRTLLDEAAAATVGHRFSAAFLFSEWSDIVDAWQIRSWEAYRDVPRLGRKTRIGGRQRELLWSIFAQVRAGLDEAGLLTWADILARLTADLEQGGARPFDFAVVDEAQDMGVAVMRFLGALGSHRPDGLFFAGDLGQRIFQTPFSWKALGIDIRGRSHTLRINYRTSHQIRTEADRLLPFSLADVDGIEESRKGTVSVFNGPPPVVLLCDHAGAEQAAVRDWIAGLLGEGFLPHEIGVFVRSEAELERARNAAEGSGAPYLVLGGDVETTPGSVSVSTMHLAKGLEFRAVAVMACDEEVLPLEERIESISDESDLEDVYNTERHLLYVACTRARDRLLVTGVDPGSEFLGDLEIVS
ncbi:MAG: UvrD-helicase domain-containing protein [Alphaproteobacteria bacterium]|jgi:hypothetical protein|nr:UvrD-helicase domain-containing protein [Alphaproteobacteria bacterium]